MGWHLNGDWDRFTTPPGVSTAELSIVASSIAFAYNERIDNINSIFSKSISNFGFRYGVELSDASFYPSPSDFNGLSYRKDTILPGSLAFGVPRDILNCITYGLSGSGIQGQPGNVALDWYKEPACTNIYSAAEISADAGTAIGIVFDGVDSSLVDGVHALSANVWLLAKEVMNRCVYIKAPGGLAHDLRPLLTDQL